MQRRIRGHFKLPLDDIVAGTHDYRSLDAQVSHDLGVDVWVRSFLLREKLISSETQLYFYLLVFALALVQTVGEKVIDKVAGAFWLSPFRDKLLALELLGNCQLLCLRIHFLI